MDWLEIGFIVGTCIIALVTVALVRVSTRIPSLPDDFDVWLRSPMVKDPITILLGEAVKEARSRSINLTEVPAIVASRCAGAVKEGKSFALALHGTFQGTIVLSTDERYRPITLETSLKDQRFWKDKAAHAKAIYLADTNGDLVVNGISINDLSVGHEFTGKLWIMNAWVRELRIKTASKGRPSIDIAQTNIGKLTFDEISCHDLAIRGGAINHIVCTAPTHDNPFSGTVTFADQPSLRALKGYGYNDAQQYRSLSMHLMKLGNVVAAKYAQVFEKRMERPDDPAMIRFVSFMYDAMSMYGTSPGRALAWLFALLIYTAALFFVLDGAVMVEKCEDLSGWKQELCSDGGIARAARSAVIAFDAAVNPFGLFSKSHVVEAKSIVLNVYLFLVGFLSIALIAQIGIGIRRRFISQ